MQLRIWYAGVFCLQLVIDTGALVSERSDDFHFRDENSEAVSEYENPCETVKVMPRIVGGSPVQSETSTPYIAAIGETLSNGSVTWYCGGSILSPYYILTAGHCLTSRNTTTVRIGSLSLKKQSGENDYPVAKTIIHPKYSAPKSYHDLAIIKVRGKMKFTDNIKPICLADGDDKYVGRMAKVIGWGAEEVGGDGSQKLQKVEVEVFSNQKCGEAYQNSSISARTFPDGIQFGQLCAGSTSGGKDACQGDSGGPLVLADNEGITRQIGVVSTGAGCGASVYPGVYARVSTYHSWVQNIVKKKYHDFPDSSKDMRLNKNRGDSRESAYSMPTRGSYNSITLSNDREDSSFKEKDNYDSSEINRTLPIGISGLSTQTEHGVHNEKGHALRRFT